MREVKSLEADMVRWEGLSSHLYIEPRDRKEGKLFIRVIKSKEKAKWN
uniref:Uncharacterized protein n=1 Tax=Arundo donax TaxID=35708 RepID=A0A0A9H0E5_ARUDO